MTSSMRSSALEKVTFTVTKFRQSGAGEKCLPRQIACTLIVLGEIKSDQSVASNKLHF